MRYTPIVPAVIPASKEAIIDFSEKLRFSREFHLDIVDGRFVQTVSWPYQPIGEPMSVKSYLDSYTLEVDLMVAEPIKAANEWIEAGADMLVFHVETLSLDEFVKFESSTTVSVGVSAHGDTPLDTLISYAKHADYIQLMGIYEIGSQGQPFDEAVITKIEVLKKHFPEKSITIDGSVNKDTIKKLYIAGADRFICGSAIVLQENPEIAHASLQALIND